MGEEGGSRGAKEPPFLLGYSSPSRFLLARARIDIAYAYVYTRIVIRYQGLGTPGRKWICDLLRNSEVSVVQRLLYYGATIRTWESVRYTEVSALQRCSLREVPLYITPTVLTNCCSKTSWRSNFIYTLHYSIHIIAFILQLIIPWEHFIHSLNTKRGTCICNWENCQNYNCSGKRLKLLVMVGKKNNSYINQLLPVLFAQFTHHAGIRTLWCSEPVCVREGWCSSVRVCIYYGGEVQKL